MNKDLWGTDNPERVAGEGEAPSDYMRNHERDPDADYERNRDEEEFMRAAAEYKLLERVYSGSLLDDCLSIVELGENLKALRAQPAGENIFQAAKRRDAEERAALNKSVYSQMARIFGDACAKHIMPEQGE